MGVGEIGYWGISLADRIQCDVSAKLQQLARELAPSLYLYSLEQPYPIANRPTFDAFLLYLCPHFNLILLSETISKTNNSQYCRGVAVKITFVIDAK